MKPEIILLVEDNPSDITQRYDLRVNSYTRKPVDFKQFMESVEHLGQYWLVMKEPPPKGRLS